MIKSLSIMIKPSSSNCNMKCSYCFYHDISNKRTQRSYGFMDINLLEVIVQKAIAEAEEAVVFAFQGGEPSLVGLDYYQRLLEYVKKYNQKKLNINYAIQTNGLLINKEWAQFLAKNHFLVGVSLDGPKTIHDFFRIDLQGRGTYQRIMEGIEYLKRYQVDFNILSVVTSQLARHPHQVYRFFQKKGFNYLQFIPCLFPLGERPDFYPYSLTPERYGSFLKKLFDLWYHDVVHHNIVSIRYFDNLLQMMLGYPPEACDMAGHCSCQFIIEADGGVYPCDFYVIDQWHLGNIKEQSFSQLLNSSLARRFIQSSTYIDAVCRKCPWFPLCRGGCRRWREPFIEGKPQLNYLCLAYKDFFSYTIERFKEIVEK